MKWDSDADLDDIDEDDNAEFEKMRKVRGSFYTWIIILK